jgi:hypothetical protein
MSIAAAGDRRGRRARSSANAVDQGGHAQNMVGRRAFALALLCLWPSSAAPAQSLVGYWYGYGYQAASQETSEFIAHYREDGIFDVRFLVHKNCDVVVDQRESGTWAMLNDETDRIVTTSIDDAEDGPYVDDYHIEELSESHVRYTHLSTAVTYAATRVDEKAKFPPCNAIIGSEDNNPRKSSTGTIGLHLLPHSQEHRQRG